MLRNRAKRKYGTVAQEIQFSGFYRTAIYLIIVKQKWFEKNSSPYIRWIKGVYSHSIPVWLYFFLGGLKAQSSAQPRASEAAPWVGLSLVKPFTPWKGKSVDIVLLFRIPSAFMFLRFCPFRAWILYFCFTYPGCRFACPGHPMLSTKF